MHKVNNPKSVQLNVRLTPESLAKINEGKDAYAETLRKSKLTMSDYIEARCSIDNVSEFSESDITNACVSSINFNKACIDVFESLIELFGDGTLGKQICSDNKDLNDMVLWGKAVVKRMQNCAGIPADEEE